MKERAETAEAKVQQLQETIERVNAWIDLHDHFPFADGTPTQVTDAAWNQLVLAVYPETLVEGEVFGQPRTSDSVKKARTYTQETWPFTGTCAQCPQDPDAKGRAEKAEARVAELEAAGKAVIAARNACDREAESHPSSRSSAPLVRYINAMAKLEKVLLESTASVSDNHQPKEGTNGSEKEESARATRRDAGEVRKGENSNPGPSVSVGAGCGNTGGAVRVVASPASRDPEVRSAAVGVAHRSSEAWSRHDWEGTCGEAMAVGYDCRRCGAQAIQVAGKWTGVEPGPCSNEAVCNAVAPAGQTITSVSVLSNGNQIDDNT